MVHRRILQVIRRWIELYWFDFVDPDVNRLLKGLILYLKYAGRLDDLNLSSDQSDGDNLIDQLRAKSQEDLAYRQTHGRIMQRFGAQLERVSEKQVTY